LWAVLSTAAAALVVFLTVRYVGRQEVVPVAEDRTVLTGFGAVLQGKYYVDELYDRFIVQPIVRASRFCWRVIDAGIIDGFVNSVGWFSKGVGWGMSLFQTGAVNTYAFILAVGVLVVLGASLL
jgi:NADH-quinone oxidoreductase subunit L